MEEIDLDKLAESTAADLKSAGSAVSAEDVAAVKDAFKKKEDEKTGLLGIPGFIKRMLAGISVIHVLIADVVHKVEQIAQDIKLAGADKRALAVKVINLLVDIPYVPENVEAWVIGYAIDAIVAAFNKKLGKAWLAKLA
jgi:hypothetical protein